MPRKHAPLLWRQSSSDHSTYMTVATLMMVCAPSE
jgi:hypothetical protein